MDWEKYNQVPEQFATAKEIGLAAARELANISLEHITKIADEFCAEHEDKEDEAMRELLQEVSYEIMKISVSKEIII